MTVKPSDVILQLQTLAEKFTPDALDFHLARAKADESVVIGGVETRFNAVLHAAELRCIDAVLNNFESYFRTEISGDMIIDTDQMYKNLLQRRELAAEALIRARERAKEAELKRASASITFMAL